MKIELEVERASVVLREGTDKVYLRIKGLPGAIVCFPSEPLTLEFDCTKGTGEEYVKTNFGIDPEVIG